MEEENIEVIQDDFTEEDDMHIEEIIEKQLEQERLAYTYKIIKQEGNKIVLQAMENTNYKIEINFNTMSSYKEYK